MATVWLAKTLKNSAVLSVKTVNTPSETTGQTIVPTGNAVNGNNVVNAPSKVSAVPHVVKVDNSLDAPTTTMTIGRTNRGTTMTAPVVAVAPTATVEND